MKHVITKTLFISLIAIAASHADAAKLYKWIDANGNISYQDQPPPQSGKILSEKEVGSSADSDPISDPLTPEVMVYTVNDCELCERLVAVLNQNKVPHIELPLEDDREAQRKILERANSIIAPTIFIGDTVIQGGTENELREALRLAGFEIEDASRLKSSNRLTIDE